MLDIQDEVKWYREPFERPTKRWLFEEPVRYGECADGIEIGFHRATDSGDTSKLVLERRDRMGVTRLKREAYGKNLYNTQVFNEHGVVIAEGNEYLGIWNDYNTMSSFWCYQFHKDGSWKYFDKDNQLEMIEEWSRGKRKESKKYDQNRLIEEYQGNQYKQYDKNTGNVVTQYTIEPVGVYLDDYGGKYKYEDRYGDPPQGKTGEYIENYSDGRPKKRGRYLESKYRCRYVEGTTASPKDYITRSKNIDIKHGLWVNYAEDGTILNQEVWDRGAHLKDEYINKILTLEKLSLEKSKEISWQIRNNGPEAISGLRRYFPVPHYAYEEFGLPVWYGHLEGMDEHHALAEIFLGHKKILETFPYMADFPIYPSSTNLNECLDYYFALRYEGHSAYHLIKDGPDMIKWPSSGWNPTLRICDHIAKNWGNEWGTSAENAMINAYLKLHGHAKEYFGVEIKQPESFNNPEIQKLLQQGLKVIDSELENKTLARKLEDNPEAGVIAANFVDVDGTLIRDGKLNEDLYGKMLKAQEQDVPVHIFTGADNVEAKAGELQRLGVDVAAFNVMSKRSVKDHLILGTVVDDVGPALQGFASSKYVDPNGSLSSWWGFSKVSVPDHLKSREVHPDRDGLVKKFQSNMPPEAKSEDQKPKFGGLTL